MYAIAHARICAFSRICAIAPLSMRYNIVVQPSRSRTSEWVPPKNCRDIFSHMDTKFMLWFINVIFLELKPPSAHNDYKELEILDVNASVHL
jgi:hypothetical protein